MNNFYKKGMTVGELLVVMAVLGLLIALVLPQFAKNKELQVLKGGVQDTLSSIDKARSETLSSLNSSSYGVHFQSDKVVIFTGTTYSAVAGSNESISFTSPASITNVTLAGVSSTSGDFYFNRLSGSPSKTGTVTVSTTNFSRIITIGATGAASSN